jgi:hypothetical protein
MRVRIANNRYCRRRFRRHISKIGLGDVAGSILTRLKPASHVLENCSASMALADFAAATFRSKELPTP